jgi:hypothetical protein
MNGPTQTTEWPECQMDGHEGVTTDAEYANGLIDPLDQATYQVRILGPKEAIEANEEVEECCAGCAGKLAEVYVSFGWDVEARNLER